MTAPNRVQYIFGVYDPTSGKLLGLAPTGNSPYASVLGNVAIVATFAALRLQLGSVNQTIFATGKATQADGSGGTFVLNAADTSGAWFTGTVSGTVLTVVTVMNGTLAVGQSINRGDTGVPIGTITSFGTGGGGVGTYNLSASATLSALMTFSADDNTKTLVGIDGSRWNLATDVVPVVDAATYGTDSGVVNAYVFTHSGASLPVTLAAGSLLRFTPLTTNTGASTLNADGTGTVAIIGVTGAALVGGELSSLGSVLLQSTGAQWQILATTGLQSGDGRSSVGTDSGAANAYVVTHNNYSLPAILTTGALLRFTPLNTNTGAVTINADGTGALAAVRANGAACTGGEFSSLGPVVAQYNGAAWQIVITAGAQPGFERIAAETTAGVTPTYYVYVPYDLRRYGADPTGVVASDTALSNAIAVCGTTGGTIRLPAGKYSFASQINLNLKNSIILQGEGSCTGGTQPATQIAYTPAGAGTFISLQWAVGCKIRDMQIVHTNAAYTGTYIKISNAAGSDPPFNELSNCVVGSSVGGVGTIHLDLDKCIAFTATACNFIYGNPSVKGAATGSYANVVRFRDCHWATNYAAPIQNGGQAWTFDGCIFEPLVTANTPAGALLSLTSSNFFNALKMTGCWFGDAGTGVGTWLDIFTQGFEFSGNYVSGNVTATTAMTLRSSFGVHIVANIFNSFLNGINVVTVGNDWVFKANVAGSVTNPWVGGNNIPTGGIDFGPNFGFGIPGTNHGLQAATGYRVHPDGTIEQWGIVNPASFGTHAITPFALTFPSVCYNVILTLSGVAATTATIYASALTTTGFTYFLTDGASTTDSFYWRAIGK